MTGTAKRVLWQGVPLAALILSVGLARQYAEGAGVFAAGNGLAARAQAALVQVQAGLRREQTSNAEPAVAAPPLTAKSLELQLAEQTIPAPEMPQPLFSRAGFSCSTAGHCR